jgi:hypothetical protein
MLLSTAPPRCWHQAVHRQRACLSVAPVKRVATRPFDCLQVLVHRGLLSQLTNLVDEEIGARRDFCRPSYVQGRLKLWIISVVGGCMIVSLAHFITYELDLTTGDSSPVVLWPRLRVQLQYSLCGTSCSDALTLANSN